MIINLKTADKKTKEEAIRILHNTFSDKGLTVWNTIKKARDELTECTKKNCICLGFVKKGKLIGWIGLRPLYNKITYELHPLVIKKEEQFKGIGTFLLKEIEKTARKKGILNIVLGTDDETGSTSLSQADLSRVDIFDAIKSIKNLNQHPYEFYQKNGYIITGIVPDANGPNKPDILMWKKLN